MYIEYNYPTYERQDLIFENDKPFSDYDFRKIIKGFFYLVLQDGGLCINNSNLKGILLEILKFRYAIEYEKHKQLIYNTNFSFHLDDDSNEILRIHNIKPNGDDELMEYYTHYLSNDNVKEFVDEMINQRIYKDWNDVLIDLFGGKNLDIAFDKLIKKTTIRKKDVNALIRLLKKKQFKGAGGDSWLRIKSSLRYHLNTSGGNTSSATELAIGTRPSKAELQHKRALNKEKERLAKEQGKEFTPIIYLDSAIGYAEQWLYGGQYTGMDLEFAVFMRLRLKQYWPEFCRRLENAFNNTANPELYTYFIKRISNWLYNTSIEYGDKYTIKWLEQEK